MYIEYLSFRSFLNCLFPNSCCIKIKTTTTTAIVVTAINTTNVTITTTNHRSFTTHLLMANHGIGFLGFMNANPFIHLIGLPSLSSLHVAIKA